MTYIYPHEHVQYNPGIYDILSPTLLLVFHIITQPVLHREGGSVDLSALSVSLQAKRAGFLHRDQQFLIQHGVWRVWRQVQTVKTGMSPERERNREKQADCSWVWMESHKPVGASRTPVQRCIHLGSPNIFIYLFGISSWNEESKEISHFNNETPTLSIYSISQVY